MNKLKFFICILFAALMLHSTSAAALSQIDTESTKHSAPVIRLSGADRYETAAAISREGWKASDYIILTSGEGNDSFADALAGSPLAYALGCPILLTETKELSQSTKNEIERLGAKKVIILGGQGAVSDYADKQLISMGLSTERLWGSDRYATAVKIAERLYSIKPFSSVFLTTGEEYQYAMMISPYASKNGIPIIFTEKKSLNYTSVEALLKWNMKKVDIVGNTDVISPSVEDNLHVLRIDPDRIPGKDMADTNINIIKKYTMNNENICIARDNLFADSIAGASFAALKDMNILLTGQSSLAPSITDFLLKSKFNSAYIFGGPGGVSDNIIAAVRAGSAGGPLFGNTGGNILNGGFSAASNGWIYYSNASTGGKLYKKRYPLTLSIDIKGDGSDKKNVSSNVSKGTEDSASDIELSGDAAAYINVMGDWIYYSNLSDGMNIYKIKSDGTCRLKLNNDRSSNVIVCDNWIYYINCGKDGTLHRMACDGTLNTQLSDKKVRSLNIDKDWVYYINNEDGYSICRIKPDNPKSIQKLSNISASTMEVSGGHIYFSNINDNNYLYSIGIDGSNLTKVSGDSVFSIMLRGNIIFYSNAGDGNKLYSIRIDGTERRKVYDGASYMMNYVEEKLCFLNSLDSPELITIKDDGTLIEKYEYSPIKSYISSIINTPASKGGSIDNSRKNEWITVIPEQNDGILIKDAFNNDGKKVVFLTFDDGPSEDVTPAILNILKKNNIKATFFVAGRMAKGHEDIVKRIYSEGHSIGNHSYSHDYSYLYSSTKSFMDEVNSWENVLKKILGDKFTTGIFRFPGGAYGNNYTDYKAALKEHGYDYINWNTSTGDSAATCVPTAALFDNFIQTSKDKDHLVILMHDLNVKTTTVEVLPKIIEYLKGQGYEFKRLK